MSALSSLVFPSGPPEEERWSDEQLEGSGVDAEEDPKDTLTSSFTSSVMSIHRPHPTSSPSDAPGVAEVWVTDKDSNDGVAPSGPEDSDEPQHHGLQSRAQSESSGEFSLSLDSEPWSNNSSPVQQLPSSSNQQPTPERASTLPTRSQEHPPRNQDLWLTRGTRSIRRGSRAKLVVQTSESGGMMGENPSKDEAPPASVVSPITVLYVQGKSSSMSGCLNCFSTPLAKEGRLRGVRSMRPLPRASSVISTADGSSRRSSVSSDGRVNEAADPPPSEPTPPVKPPRDPAVVVSSETPKAPVQESLAGSSFTFTSVFSNTIFSDSVVTTTSDCQNRDDSSQTDALV